VFIIAKSVDSVLRNMHRTETGRMLGSYEVWLPVVYVAVNDCDGEWSITSSLEETPFWSEENNPGGLEMSLPEF
jgi:hypothetical protein